METSMRVTDSPVCPAYSALDLPLPPCLHLQGLAVTTSTHLIATGLRPVRPKARFPPFLTRLWSLWTPASDPRAPQKSTSVLPGFSPLAGPACGHLPTTLLCCPPPEVSGDPGPAPPFPLWCQGCWRATSHPLCQPAGPSPSLSLLRGAVCSHPLSPGLGLLPAPPLLGVQPHSSPHWPTRPPAWHQPPPHVPLPSPTGSRCP